MTEIDLTLLGRVLIKLEDDATADIPAPRPIADDRSREAGSFESGTTSVPGHIDMSMVQRRRRT